MNAMVSSSPAPMAQPPRSNPFLRSSSDAPPFPCITPSTVTCVTVVSFMIVVPFAVAVARGALLSGRSPLPRTGKPRSDTTGAQDLPAEDEPGGLRELVRLELVHALHAGQAEELRGDDAVDPVGRRAGRRGVRAVQVRAPNLERPVVSSEVIRDPANLIGVIERLRLALGDDVDGRQLGARQGDDT